MKLLQALVDGFILAMGITPPKPERKRMVTIVIASGLFVVIAALVALFLFVITAFFRQ